MTTIGQKRKEVLNRELNRILDILIKKYSRDKIILFGSLSSGRVYEWSDIDLVIIKDTSKRFIDRLHEVRLMTRPLEGVDFIVYTPQEVKNMRKEKRWFLLEEVLGRGKVIYEKRNNNIDHQKIIAFQTKEKGT